MFRYRKKRDVLWTVIQFISVFMVSYLGRHEVASQLFLKGETMFGDISSPFYSVWMTRFVYVIVP